MPTTFSSPATIVGEGLASRSPWPSSAQPFWPHEYTRPSQLTARLWVDPTATLRTRTPTMAATGVGAKKTVFKSP
eukprot:scaffold24196_cov120-Isochrysis_galbana.AAC.3